MITEWKNFGGTLVKGTIIVQRPITSRPDGGSVDIKPLCQTNGIDYTKLSLDNFIRPLTYYVTATDTRNLIWRYDAVSGVLYCSINLSSFEPPLTFFINTSCEIV